MNLPALPQLPGIPTNPAPMAAAPKARTWSKYQDAVFNCAANGTGNIIVDAVAGSGKTTTLVEALKRWQQAGNSGRAIFVAFNKSIATELERRVPVGVDAKTLHGACYGAIRRQFKNVKVDDHKIDEVALAAVATQHDVNLPGARKLAMDLIRCYGLLKGTMTNLNDAGACMETIDAYDITLDAPSEAIELLPTLDTLMRKDTSRISFDEMLSFVIDFDCPVTKYDLVMVDESQDLNLLQIEILKRMLRSNGRLCACGDPFQSIYLFRGADNAAMDRIRTEFNIPAENQLPLSITYRCGRKIVAYAQQYVKHIEAAPEAHEGVVEERDDSASTFTKTLFEMQPGEMGICRANAPLVSCALKLIAAQRPAVIKGRDIGKSVQKLARDLMKKASSDSIESLARTIVQYQDMQTRKLRAAKKDRQADGVEDRCETLLAIINGAQSMREVEQRIDTLFSDSARGDAVVFSSIHKSKGLEADTVVWIGPEISDWILNKCKNESAKAQEANLSYVAITRAKNRLVVQPLPPKGKEE